VGLKFLELALEGTDRLFQTYPRGVEVSSRTTRSRRATSFRRTLVGLKLLGDPGTAKSKLSFRRTLVGLKLSVLPADPDVVLVSDVPSWG